MWSRDWSTFHCVFFQSDESVTGVPLAQDSDCASPCESGHLPASFVSCRQHWPVILQHVSDYFCPLQFLMWEKMIEMHETKSGPSILCVCVWVGGFGFQSKVAFQCYIRTCCLIFSHWILRKQGNGMRFAFGIHTSYYYWLFVNKLS